MKRDIKLCYPKLKPNGFLIFDDYFIGFSDLVKAVNEELINLGFNKIMVYQHSLIFQKK